MVWTACVKLSAATLPDPAIVVGGTPLLAQFLAIVGASSRGGQLAIATPYMTGGAVTAVRAWEYANHRQIDLLVVTARFISVRATLGFRVSTLAWAL